MGRGPAVLVSTAPGRKIYRVDRQNKSAFEVEERFDVHEVIGRGSYGVVCSGVDGKTSLPVAIKKIEKLFSDLTDGRRIWREVVVLRLLRDAGVQNVLQLVGLQRPKGEAMTFDELYIVTDLFRGDLALLRTEPADVKRRAVADMLTGVAGMHYCGVIHRDIKPQNVLVDTEGHATLCDFGLARGGVVPPGIVGAPRGACVPAPTAAADCPPLTMTDHVITRWYRPPEILLLSRYSCPVDVWCVGCVAAEMFLKQVLFAGADYLDQLRRIAGAVAIRRTDFVTNSAAEHFLEEIALKTPAPPSFSERLIAAGAPADLAELTERMISFDPRDRPTAAQALETEALDRPFRPGRPAAELAPADWSMDASQRISEKRLRRAFWHEVERAVLR